MALARAWCLLVGLVVALTLGPCSLAAIQDAKHADADRLVAAAAEAKVHGDNARSFALLHEAIQADPENRLARWQLGEIQVDNKWMSVEEAQRRAAVDPRQAEYRKRRKATGDGPQGQLLLARWCRKSNLNKEAQFHWANVLTLDPKNDEALKALNLRWHNGRLVAQGQLAQDKNRLKEANRAAERWSAKFVGWRRVIASHDLQARNAALGEIRSIAENDAIPTFEEITLGRDARSDRHADECFQIGLAFLDALSRIPGQPATESIVRHAVFAPSEQVRKSAIEKLKPRDQYDYVPMLLSGLGMPIESTFNVMTGPDGSVHYFHSLFREGPESDWAADIRHTAIQRDFGSRHMKVDVFTGLATEDGLYESPIVKAARKSAVASSYQTRFGSNAAATELKVANANEAIDTLNTRIVPVLAAATGQSFGDNPKAWWDWWRKQNEYYASGDHPVERYYYSDTAQYYYGFPSYNYSNSGPPAPLPPGYQKLSCFVKGTKVWTKTGARPIETIELGDLVLAQDVNSGELKYEPVIGRTVRPPSSIVKISFDKDTVLATKGHPFWVTGTGWRMAKEVADGDVLHGLAGCQAIRKVESAGEAEAYNLVVAELSTYFVGEDGILVHDNTPRLPTQAIVPGIVAR